MAQASKTLKEYEDEALQKYNAIADSDIEASNKVLDAQKQNVQNNYQAQIKNTNSSYEDALRSNETQKILNSRAIERRMGEMGLTDSGANRTQQTAIQLAAANNQGEIQRQRQNAVDTLARTMAADLNTIESEKAAKAQNIRNARQAEALSQAANLYNNDLQNATNLEITNLNNEADIKKAETEGYWDYWGDVYKSDNDVKIADTEGYWDYWGDVYKSDNDVKIADTEGYWDYWGDVYKSDNELEGTKHKADKELEGTKHKADKELEGTKYKADKELEGTKYISDKEVEKAGTEGLWNYLSDVYKSDNELLGTQYKSDKELEADEYTADKNYQGKIDVADKELAAKANSEAAKAEKELQNSRWVYTGQTDESGNLIYTNGNGKTRKVQKGYSPYGFNSNTMYSAEKSDSRYKWASNGYQPLGTVAEGGNFEQAELKNGDLGYYDGNPIYYSPNGNFLVWDDETNKYLNANKIVAQMEKETGEKFIRPKLAKIPKTASTSQGAARRTTNQN